MPKFKFKIAYDGSNYHGWQYQPNQITVQGEIKKRLQYIFPNEHISLPGAGRTDAGVHASAQVGAVSVSVDYFTPEKLERTLNSHLPDDIRVYEMEVVEEDFHPTLYAKSRRYCYRLVKDKNVFTKNLFWYKYFDTLNIQKIKEALKMLEGEYDFTTYSNVLADKKFKICTVFNTEVIDCGNTVEIWIEGNRFLHNMVRKIVGTLLQISEKNLPTSHAYDILLKKDRLLSGRTVPPDGLTFELVRY